MATAKLTRKQVDALRRRLEEERSRIARVLQAPAPAAGEEREPEVEEAAQRETERSQGLEIVARERALLAEVERALEKMRAGTYGVSEKTGAPIPYERLAAVPWARQDVDE